MPELPEVEEAKQKLDAVATGQTISVCEVKHDEIVYGKEGGADIKTICEGKKVKRVGRKGKNFFMVLEGGPSILFHFGMSGTAHINGTPSPTYRVPRAHSNPTEWPPKYLKLNLTLSTTTTTTASSSGDNGTTASTTAEWAFCDARRLGRIKVVECGGEGPETREPLSLLGADPLLEMPSVETLYTAVHARKAPIKAVLLDQNGPLCGIGNWMADEILFQSRLHPAHPSSLLTLEQVTTLHHQIVNVTNTAVEANAVAEKFPNDWLFAMRWGKGKKGVQRVTLPNGDQHPLTFHTVAGRTSAMVEAVQRLPEDLQDEFDAKVERLAVDVKKGRVKGKGRKGKLSEEEKERGKEADDKVETNIKEEKSDDVPTTPVTKRRTRSERTGEVQEEEVTSPYFKKKRK